VLGLPAVLVPPNPGNVSAFGLLTVDVKNDYVQTHVSLADHLEPGAVATILDALTAQAAEALTKEGFAAEQHSFARTADLRYFGQAFEVRVPVPDGPVDAGVLAEVARRFHAEHRALYGYDFAGDASQQVEWVNLRVSGIGPIQRPEIRRVESSASQGAGTPARADDPKRRQVCFEAGQGYVETPVLWRADLAPGTVVTGPAIIEEFGSTVPLHPGFTARIDEYLNIIVTRVETQETN
jgi:N-methylhydantoinase A